MDVMQELERVGAVYTGKHFAYTSGKHGDAYINMDPLFPSTPTMMSLVPLVVGPFVGQFDTLAAPATGGIVLAVHGAIALARLSEGSFSAAAVWADKQSDDGFQFERAGFVEHLRGKRVLVVEDLLNTAGSVAKVIEQVQIHGGEVIGVSVVCNRGTMTAEGLGVPRLEALANVSMAMFDPDECPHCIEGRPIVTDIGHGAKFLADNPDYAGGSVRLLEAA